VVTGTGRCGTVYMARLLTSVGIPCGHESIFDWHGPNWATRRLNGEEPIECSCVSTMRFDNGSWTPIPNWVDAKEIVAESSYMAAPFLKDILKDVPVIHVVRNPIKVINSFCNYLGYFQSSTPSNTYEQFIYRHIPSLREDMSPYDRAAVYYAGWNAIISRTTKSFFRLEDGPDSILKMLGKDGDHFDDRAINTQKKPMEKFSMGQLSEYANGLVRNVGEAYGYDLDKLVI